MEVPKFILDNTSGKMVSCGSFQIRKELYGNYDFRVVIVTDQGYAKECIIGRGSISAFLRVRQFTLDKNISPILEVGRMGQYALESDILVDGEHPNDDVINIDLSMFPAARLKLTTEKKFINTITEKGKTVIGSGVILSRRSMVVSGVKIGNGVVVGAGAVVTKDVPPYAIVAGNPARVIRYRFDKKTIEKLEEIRWWDFDFDYLISNFHDIQKMSPDEFVERFGDVSKNKYHTSSDRFVFDKDGPKGRCIGCDLDGQFVPYDELNETIKYYISQASMPDNTQIHIVRNILDCRE